MLRVRVVCGQFLSSIVVEMSRRFALFTFMSRAEYEEEDVMEQLFIGTRNQIRNVWQWEMLTRGMKHVAGGF